MCDVAKLFGAPRDLLFVESILLKERFDPRDDPSMSKICGARSTFSPPAFIAVGIRRAPGKYKERSRSQSRFFPAGPEIPS